MIFDRTIADIQSAINIVETKVKNFEELLDSDIQTLERGCFTVSTLNRIEETISFIVQKMKDFGNIVHAETNEWNENDIFKTSDFTEILNKISYLRSKIKVKSDTPNVPIPEFTYVVLNDIEKILYDIKTLVENTEKSFVFSGEIFSGEVI